MFFLETSEYSSSELGLERSIRGLACSTASGGLPAQALERPPVDLTLFVCYVTNVFIFVERVDSSDVLLRQLSRLSRWHISNGA